MDLSQLQAWLAGLGWWGPLIAFLLPFVLAKLGVKVPLLTPAPKPDEPAATVAPTAQPVGGLLGGRQPVRDLIRSRLIARAQRETGRSEADVAAAVDAALAQHEVQAAATGRPFLDWLLSGGFQQILDLVLLILKVLA